MIVREVLNPEFSWENFDFPNDGKDTLAWLAVIRSGKHHGQAEEAMMRLMLIRVDVIKQKAALWDALMSCQRIRLIGSAKLGDPNFQHMGLELWAKYPNEHNDKHARETLLQFLQAMLPLKE